MVYKQRQFTGLASRLGFAVFPLVLLCLTAGGQNSPVTPLSPPPSGGGEEQSRTIGKCLSDLAHTDPEIRLRSVMILGKYLNDTTAQAGLVKALSDPDKRVRRGAVVSLADTDFFVSSEAAQALLNTLNDPDVQTRRLVSSMLDKIIPSLPRRGVLVTPGDTLTYRPGFSQSDTKKLVGGFADSDALVRKNMLAVAFMLPNAVSADVIAGLLADPDPETRAMAIPALRRRASLSQWLQLTAPLVSDPAAPVRRALAVAAAAERDRATITTLKTLATDPESGVRAAAVQGLFQLGIPIDKDRFLTLINSPEIRVADACRLISLFPVTGAETKRVLTALSHHKTAAFRASALRAFAAVRGGLSLQTEDLLPFLADPDPGVRQQAERLLLIEHNLAADTVKALVTSAYPDVRMLALTFSRTLPDKTGNDILEALLLDDNTTVRVRVLSEYGRRRHPEALDILSASLEDDNADIRLAAAVALLRMQTPAARQILSAAAKRTRDSTFKDTLTSFVVMMQAAEDARHGQSKDHHSEDVITP